MMTNDMIVKANGCRLCVYNLDIVLPRAAVWRQYYSLILGCQISILM